MDRLTIFTQALDEAERVTFGADKKNCEDCIWVKSKEVFGINIISCGNDANHDWLSQALMDEILSAGIDGDLIPIINPAEKCKYYERKANV